jgi:RNA polymerase sigma-70 factor, ECF subfamily
MYADAARAVEALYRSDWGRIVATLIGLVGDFDLAEESAQEAFTAAVDQWLASGVPEFPRAWIIQTARHKAIDRIRSRVRSEEKLAAYATSGLVPIAEEPDYDEALDAGEIPDERLRLIFTCCHPALALEAQVALHGLFWCLQPPWRRDWYAPNARFATPAFRISCPGQARCRNASTPCWP